MCREGYSIHSLYNKSGYFFWGLFYFECDDSFPLNVFPFLTEKEYFLQCPSGFSSDRRRQVKKCYLWKLDIRKTYF